MKHPLPPIAGALKDNLLDWEDFDVAAYKLGISLGIFVSDDGSYDQFREYKSIFYTSNPAGEFLLRTLKALIALGVLEENDLRNKIRWRAGSERELLA